ncbi:MAG: hypothetical protein A2270_07905 [Elusimicrobia bacterium RIFOXYA12_FULL_51_18]|nr:MAG: hypothetical protein A2270_07905 [Elusimicrobia bacterium RIFOXYA12_FULL_51_18]OGS29985.1 MAG: hypothetical protein A2218_12575 [Elusimicrobia bacterium RIFOXYA2_FULL_53_38]
MGRLILVSFIWAFSFGINKQWVAGADPVIVTMIRLSLATLALGPLLRWPIGGRPAVFRLMAIGAVQYGLMYTALNYCFLALHAYQVALFTVLTPLYVALLHSARRGEWRAGLFSCALLALTGAAMVERWPEDRRAFWAAFAVMQASNLAFAWGQLAYRDWRRRNPLEQDARVFGWLYIGGALVSLPWVLLGPGLGETLQYGHDRLTALTYLGLVASGLGFYLWNTGATRVSAGALAAMNNLKSPLAVLVSICFFGGIGNMSAQDWFLLVAGALCIMTAAAAAGDEASDPGGKGTLLTNFLTKSYW